MNAESFLKVELKKIDLGSGREKTHFSFDAFPLVDLLFFAATEEVFYFESKEEDFSFLGLGKSTEIDLTKLHNYLATNPEDILVYQGLFEDESDKLTYIPEWCFVRRGGVVTLKINNSLDYASRSPSNIIFNTEVWESFVGSWVSYEEKPERDEWHTMINQSLRLFNKKELEKIVLSRKKIFNYDEPIEMAVMFRELYEANKASSHFTIFHQFYYQKAFISFTPERLFTLKDKKLETISLAGSTMRGIDDAEDKALEETLINSDKLIREHALVTKAIEQKLNPLMDELTIAPLVTMKLPYIQHRQAKITGTLKQDTPISDLIECLHPTPAVGGLPSTSAQNKILEIEKEKRNYYAAPVGVISKNYSEIAVGIRSALIEESMITVYGGAGIVLGSVAEDEWNETGAKMQPFTKVLNKSVL